MSGSLINDDADVNANETAAAESRKYSAAAAVTLLTLSGVFCLFYELFLARNSELELIRLSI